MLRVDWNALRPGDALHVHAFTSSARAEAAAVVFVEMRHRENGVGVRVGVGATSRVTWPSRQAAHLELLAPAGACWRCDADTSGIAGRERP